MAKKKKKKRARTERREAERRRRKLVADRLALALLEPGGRAERPLEVPTAAIVETRAESLGCPRCEGSLRSVAHDANTVDGVLLRKVSARCLACDEIREVWIRIVAPKLN